MKESQLLKIIKDNKLLPDDKLKKAISARSKQGSKTDLANAIVKLGYMSEREISELLARSESVPILDIGSHIVDAFAMDKLPKEFLEKHRILPLADEKGKIILAMAEPIDIETVEEIQFMTNCLVETVLAPYDRIKKAMDEYYSLPPHERMARSRQAAQTAPSQPKPIPKSPHLAEVLAELLVERGLVTREEITARLKTREL